ncbi:MAG: transcription-repair coupling factor [Bacteroidales bacterium]|nr:transcription-repair coupling factor [Bacteroidales bacterium]
MTITELYSKSLIVEELSSKIGQERSRVNVSGMVGSQAAAVAAALFRRDSTALQLHIAANKEEAYYLAGDLELLLDDADRELSDKTVVVFPTTYRRPYVPDEVDNANVLLRSEVVRSLAMGRRRLVVTYPEALAEKVVSRKTLSGRSLELRKGDSISMDDITDILQDYNFERVDFVAQPGDYAVRGGIIDVFSYASEHPFRIEFFGDDIDSLRSFDTVSQLSTRKFDSVTILPNLHSEATEESRVLLLEYFGSADSVWLQSVMYVCDSLDHSFSAARAAYDAASSSSPVAHLAPELLYSDAHEFLDLLLRCRIVEYGNSCYFAKADRLKVQSEPQPSFSKQFDLLIDSLRSYGERSYRMFVTTSSEQQSQRLAKVFDQAGDVLVLRPEMLQGSLSHGFVDHDNRLLCFTDHEIFDRYHKYRVHDMSEAREALTVKELLELKPGDYVTHIDYGVGRFSGLEKVTKNGKTQEYIRIIYKNDDTLYISIHGLHKISRYVGKEGAAPKLNRLGSNSWQVLKQKTKKHVKDIAKELIALYAKRKASRGFAFSADGYLQQELEASFLYEDTPDQLKATIDLKRDMESSAPMDRLVCGDVGFGKTEVAIRAAFKACCDSKQVAVLVPNTILAFQHYNTFRDRLKDMPVRVDYLNRFRSAKEKRQIYADVADGKIDILIGTHAITNKDLHFRDLGLLIIDEEQKFGVAAKEKLKSMKANVDCLTLTATPIPRTLQFSLMGARDLSVIQTPPPNRQPIETELCPFSEDVIRDAVMYEMSRGGQVFFVSNRVENMPEMAGLVSRLVPDARVAIAHGQMEGRLVEDTLLQFLAGDIDVLVATSIVENGLDIPNANTMIVNNAQNFGLSDLHQIRGRVGRSNRKAFCYLLVPSLTSLTADAQKRLKAIEEFSSIGSGFNIAMRDLDIRGAGNILGAEQSGFISEIGYDMYHKILNEAIQELKESDFKDLFAEETRASGTFVQDCTLETDLKALIPDEYVSSTLQRLQLYKELADLSTPEDLDAFRLRLADRFGPVPPATDELIRAVTLRQRAKHLAIDRLIIKQDTMTCYFAADKENPFYSSPSFGALIRFVQSQPNRVRMREQNGRLTLTVSAVSSISQALDTLAAMQG